MINIIIVLVVAAISFVAGVLVGRNNKSKVTAIVDAGKKVVE